MEQVSQRDPAGDKCNFNLSEEMMQEIRDLIAFALNDELSSGADSPDWNDCREIDRLVNRIMPFLEELIPRSNIDHALFGTDPYQYHRQLALEVLPKHDAMWESPTIIGDEMAQVGKRIKVLMDESHGWGVAKAEAELMPIIQQQRDEIVALKDELKLQKGANAAQDEREAQAGERCGISAAVWGCDWPDHVADLVEGLRAEIKSIKADRAFLIKEDTEHAKYMVACVEMIALLRKTRDYTPEQHFKITLGKMKDILRAAFPDGLVMCERTGGDGA